MEHGSEGVENYARRVNSVDICQMEHEHAGVFTPRLIGGVMLANAVQLKPPKALYNALSVCVLSLDSRSQ